MRIIRFMLLLLLLSLLAGCQKYWASPPAGQEGPTAEAYPPPVWTEEPTEPPLPTMTPLPTVPTTPTPTYPPGPPKPTPEVTPILPFPTPAFPPIPQGERPAALGTIWYPYLPSPDARPVLKGVLVDEKGRRWGETEHIIDLGLDAPGPLSAKRLWALYPSSDGRFLVADIGHEHSWSLWLDPTSGEVKPIMAGSRDTFFLAWGPTNRQVFVRAADVRPKEIWLLNLDTQEYRVIPFPTHEFGYLLVRAIAVSPNGLLVADVSIYPRTGPNDTETVEIGLQPLTEGSRTALVTFRPDGGAEVPVSCLAWSPDGGKLALILLTGIHDADPSNDDARLWLIQKDGSPATFLARQAYGPIMWSPDGRYIAFVRRTTYERPAPADLWLLDVAASTEIQLTQFDDRQYVTSLAWSPDGQHLAFAVTVEIGDSVEGYDKIGDYGEIWITSLDGKEQYPVAGPTAPDAPVVWLPATKGGQK